MQPDTYNTLEDSSTGFYKIKGSKFYSYAFHLSSEKDLKLKINEIKKEHYNARHHCYAYRFKEDYSMYRVNDDGEPNNSAGKPILGQIDALELTNTAVVVTRYFGGTKLGVGGMINAYKESAFIALKNGTIIKKTINNLFEISFGYPEMNTVIRFVKELNGTIKEQKLKLDCKLIFSIRKKDSNKAIDKFSGIKNIYIKQCEID